MRKKLFSTFIMCIMLFSLSGCVKYEATMDIKSDKSMDYKILYGIDKSLSDSGEMTTDEEELAEFKKQGYEVENYEDDKYKGYLIKKHIKNLDEVSSEDNVTYSLSDLFTNTTVVDNNMFQVTKGLFKNTYKATFTFAVSGDESESEPTEWNFEDTSENEDEWLDETNEINEEINDENEFNPEEEEKIEEFMEENEFNPEEESTDEFDMSGFDALENMEMPSLKFKVNLPYSALNHNANSTNNDSKELTWDLSTTEEETNIEFEFELYNMTNLYILFGGLLLIIIILLIILFSKLKKK